MANIKLFEDKKIRSVWNKEEEKWYFSISDIVFILTDSVDVTQYIKKIRSRDGNLNSYWGTNCTLVVMKALDGKMRKVNAFDTEGVLRVIQSIPSSKAEPFKRWLAKVGYERLEEIEKPELAMDRMKSIYERKGYSETWIEQRSRGIITRHKLTDEWRVRGAETRRDYAILTDEIYKAGFDLDAKSYKKYKKINQRKSLRDSMTNIELALTNLGEASAVEIHQEYNTQGFDNLKSDTKKAGNITRVARQKLEEELKRPVISGANHKDLTNKNANKKLD